LPHPPTLFFFGDGVSGECLIKFGRIGFSIDPFTGLLDISAAKHADLLFVKSKPGGDNDLAAYCKREGIRHVSFKNFEDALLVVRDIVDGKKTIADVVSAN